jgi:DNA polymerase-3 subunit gamma/tau
MDSFHVSARKYRPITFESVVGQGSITTTLKNAIKSNKLTHAFLFCGPRGVGKTTCARILAKTLNCQQPGDKIEPCNQCVSCLSFNESHSFNIHELDAASNNSVDDIKNLIDQVRFAPQIGKYSIYIIDEVHMLSTSAFNAFLKTLEEPPAHAIFILATTEKHKIIPTILSRCQIFDFKRIQIADIAHHLAYVAHQEGIQYEDDALHIIAQKADGALRDALSIFDQIASFSARNITYKAVIDNLNILDYDYFFRITDLIQAANLPDSLMLFDEILKNGFDGYHFISGLASHFRDLLVCKDASTLSLLEVGNNIAQKYHQQALLCNTDYLIKAINACSKCDVQYKGSSNQRLTVELLLMNLCGLLKSPSPMVTAPQTIMSTPVQPKVDIPLVQVSNPAQPTNTKTKTESLATNISANIQAESFVQSPLAQSSPQPKAQFINVAVKETSYQSAAVLEKPVVRESNPIKTTAYKSKTISISQLTNSVKQKASEVATEEVLAHEQPKDTFTVEQLHLHWKGYAEKINKKGKVYLFSTLTKMLPLLRENFTVELSIENKTQEEELSLEKSELLTYLREKLNNYSIQLKTVMVELKEAQRLYTPFDKYKHMAEKNENLNKLKQQLDLEILF